jgi:hypothetical protein
MSFIKIDIHQSRDRKVYYAKGFADFQLKANREYLLDWYANEDCTGKSCRAIELGEIGEYRMHLYFYEANDSENGQSSFPGCMGTGAFVVSDTNKWDIRQGFITTFEFGLVKFFSVQDLPQFYIKSRKDTTFRCTRIMLIIEQTV